MPGEKSWVEIVGTRTEITPGMSLQELLGREGGEDIWGNNPVVLAEINGRRAGLSEPLWGEEQIELIRLNDPEAHSTSLRTLCFVLAAAAEQLFPDDPLWIDFSYGPGIYCELRRPKPISRDELARLEARMREIADRNIALTPQVYGLRELLRMLKRTGRAVSFSAARYLGRDSITLHRMSGTHHIFYGMQMPSTGLIPRFKLQMETPGFVLLYGLPGDLPVVPTLEPQTKLLAVLREYSDWLNNLGINDIGCLNQYVVEGRTTELVQICEARHDRIIVQSANQVTQLPESGRLILVAGPSSSGKTTFAKRLAVQLRVLGFRPIALSLDDYFLDRTSTPRDGAGDYDYESLAAIQIDLFNEHLQSLMRGQPTRLATYDFQTGQSSLREQAPAVRPGAPIIVEGIHALNPALTPDIPQINKLHVYVSALNHMNIDNFSYIPTTLTRLYRRLVRDAQFRGYTAAQTLSRWPKVREGEQQHVFSHQQNADIFFNSGLAYELGVLKLWAEPRLAAVQPDDPNYGRARSLLEMLTLLLPIDARQVPATSLLREFIGESGFHY